MWSWKIWVLLACYWAICEATVYRRDHIYGPRYRPLWPKGAKNKYTRRFGRQSVKDLIENAGFIYENYTITTEDGYILNMNRMIHPESVDKKDKGYPLLLMNGFAQHADSWLIHDDMDSNLAAVWGALGYDVWIGDQRATIRSKGHVKYDPETDKEYWDHSTEETALYDYSAFIDFVLQKTSHKNLVITCISLGCGYHAALVDLRPEYNEKILGALYFNPLVNNIRRIADMPLTYQIGQFLPLSITLAAYKKTGLSEFPPRLIGLKKELYHLCRPAPGPLVWFLKMVNRGAFHQPMTEATCYAGALTVGGSSIKSARHLQQMYEKGEFIRYDYGREENIRRYGQESAPMYDLKKITSFVAVYYSDADSFISLKGIQKTLKSLGGPTYSCLMPFFNHLDVGAGTVFKYVFPDANQVLDSLVGYANDHQKKAMSGKCPSMEWIRSL